MCCDAELRGPVHPPGANLNLVELPAGSEDGRVERLVAVGLRRGDVVLDPLLKGRPLVVDDAERVITGGNAIQQYPNGHEVVDLFQRFFSLLHLAIDRPQMLWAPGDLIVFYSGLLLSFTCHVV